MAFHPFSNIYATFFNLFPSFLPRFSQWNRPRPSTTPGPNATPWTSRKHWWPSWNSTHPRRFWRAAMIFLGGMFMDIEGFWWIIHFEDMDTICLNVGINHLMFHSYSCYYNGYKWRMMGYWTLKPTLQKEICGNLEVKRDSKHPPNLVIGTSRYSTRNSEPMDIPFSTNFPELPAVMTPTSTESQPCPKPTRSPAEAKPFARARLFHMRWWRCCRPPMDSRRCSVSDPIDDSPDIWEENKHCNAPWKPCKLEKSTTNN